MEIFLPIGLFNEKICQRGAQAVTPQTVLQT
jgi:hypothetical protein